MSAVEVNEAKVLASGRGVNYWLAYRQRAEKSGRIEIITASIGGDRVSIPCATVAHAEWVAAILRAKGVPTTALKVTR